MVNGFLEGRKTILFIQTSCMVGLLRSIDFVREHTSGRPHIDTVVIFGNIDVQAIDLSS